MIYRLICLACMVLGYLFGMFQTAYFVGKAKRIDIRTKGSGNLGTTNVIRVLGTKWGIITFVGDLVKVFLVILITYLVIIIGLRLPIDRMALCLYTGFGAVLGHNYPFYLGFKGGKGVAASAAVLIATLDWKIFVIGLGTFVAVAVISKYVSLASMSFMLVELVIITIFSLTGIIPVTPGWRVDCIVVVAVMTALLIFQHRKNIMRLASGTENKFRFKTEKEAREEYGKGEDNG